MTREEQISNGFIEMMKGFWNNPELETFCKQEPCEDEELNFIQPHKKIKVNLVPCEDAISRQAVLDLIADYDLSMGQVVKGIHALPPVNPQEPKTGHWIYIGNSNVNGLKICKCDVCGKRAYGSHAFCHNCGARMVEPQESEE